MATSNTFTVSVRGDFLTFTSAFASLADAYRALQAAILDGQFKGNVEFADNLLGTARARKLTTKQVAWLHKLATDVVNPAGASRPAVAGINLLPIVTMLQRAAAAQKRLPKIVLASQHVDSGNLVLALAGENSKSAGTVTVTDGRPFGENQFFGRIEVDGSLTRGRAMNEAVLNLLFALANDPAKVAAQHGVATGSCCFCRRTLSTKESRSVGYGPDCAERLGLPWGEVSKEVEAADAAAREPITFDEAYNQRLSAWRSKNWHRINKS